MRNRTGSLDLLVAEALSVGHGSTPVCAPVDLRLAPGRALAVVGPNGSGKSTLLRTLVGLLEPLDGTVAFDGAPVDERAAAFRRDVAAVLDDDAFFVSLTGREHLLLTARGHGVAAPDEVVDAEVEAFGLAERADALPSALSSGQRRRLALAAAFVRPARLLVLDESGPVVSTPMGVLPAGVGATLVQGVDVGIAGSLPLLAALGTGGPTPLLVAVQAAWSLLLATAVLVQLGRRRTS